MSDAIRKPRSDSTLEGLEEDQISQLCDWLLTPGQPYRVTRELCGKEFGIWPSDSQLSRFYHRYVGVELVARRRRAVSVSEEIATEVEQRPGAFDEATIAALRQKAFELASSPLVNPKDVKAIFSLVLKSRDQDLKNRDIDIKLRRLEALEKQQTAAKEILSDGGLTIEERERRMKEKFGIS